MEIEVGEYVRTRSGLIEKVKNIVCKGYPVKKLEGSIICDDEDNSIIELLNIIKHSKNIIDLIEEGDYVNGHEVMNVYVPNDIWEPIEIEVNDRVAKHLLKDEIKTIVTKEQMKSVEYKIEEVKDEQSR